MKYLPLVGYVATIFTANWAITTFGLVPVGFGLLAPAGVYAAGLAFTLRDATHEALGRRWTYGAILAGAGLSAFLSGPLAIASGLAFLLSETLDLAIYTPLRERHWDAAVWLSGLAGAVLDSAVFLLLAFGSLDFLLGQAIGKGYMIALAWALWRLVRRASVARHASA